MTRMNSPRMPGNEAGNDLYAGPLEFIEHGARGFLITTLPRKEEFGVDDAMDLLRQTAIKLYGGYKFLNENRRNLDSKGYVKVDCLDLENVQEWPHPGGEAQDQPQEKKDGEEDKDDHGEDKMEDEAEVKTETMEEEKIEEKKEKMEDETEEKGDGEEDKAETEVKKEGGEEKTEEEKEEEEKRASEKRNKWRDSDIPRMHSIYKFKAYRTEMRNSMFIKSDVPNPMLLAEAAMELVLKRKKVTGDAVCQLLPVLGVCAYDYQQVEIMVRRTLSEVFNAEDSGEPQSYGLMLVDKLCEPGSELVFEIVRNTIWAVNPLVSQCSPVCEPDFVIRLELIGSSMVLSCVRNYMKYRQYCPVLLVDVGEGHAEEDDGGAVSEEAKKILEEKRIEKEKEREKQKAKEQERQKERAKKQAEAEKKRKQREEERKKKKKEKKEAEEEKKKNSKENEDKEDKEEDKEGTPPSKKQKTDTEDEEGDKMEASINEETPPSKKQRVDSGGINAAQDDMAEGEEQEESIEKNVEEDEEEQEEEKKPVKKTTRGKRGGRRKNSEAKS